MYIRTLSISLVNQTPIPQHWVYYITSTWKEGLGTLDTVPWHNGMQCHVKSMTIIQLIITMTCYSTRREHIAITLSVTEITQLAILFTPGSERRLKKSSYSAKFKTQLLQLNNFSSTHHIVLSIEDRADFHCWLKPPHKCTQTTLIC